MLGNESGKTISQLLARPSSMAGLLKVKVSGVPLASLNSNEVVSAGAGLVSDGVGGMGAG